MKKIFSILLLGAFLLFASMAYATTRLAWDAPAVGIPTGYIIYYGLGADKDQFNYNVDLVLECPIETLNLAPGKTYFFTVRAYNSAGESLDSNEVEHTATGFLPPADNRPIKIIIPGSSIIYIQ